MNSPDMISHRKECTPL